MKKSIILISTFLFITSLSADCKKTEIAELKYMSKDELIEKYKNDNKNYVLADNISKKWAKEAISGEEAIKKASTSELHIAVLQHQNAITFGKEASCLNQEIQNTSRVLKKDFKMTDKDLQKLK